MPHDESESVVQPATGAPAPVEVESTQPTTAATPPAKGELSDDLLKLPALQALMAGSPPAFSVNFKTDAKTPELQVIAANKDALMAAGIAFYAARQGGQGVVFNQLKIAAETIKQADAEGRLEEVAPPLTALNTAVQSAGPENNPVLSAEGPSGGSATPEAPNVPQTASGALPAPQAASAQAKTASARAKNLQPGSPTSGPKPGSGRLLNAILRPAI